MKPAPAQRPHLRHHQLAVPVRPQDQLHRLELAARRGDTHRPRFAPRLLRQAALKLGMKPDEIRFMLPREIAAALKAGAGPKELSRERMKYCIFSQKEAFGTFYVGERAARTGRNPRTGKTLEIKAAKSPKFRAGKGLKDSVN